MRLEIAYLAVLMGNIVFFTSLYTFFPFLRDNLVEEDKLLENLTALLFLQGFILGIFEIYKAKLLSKTKLYLVIPMISLLGFLDELSFGERIINFSAPVVYGIKIDAAHDFFDLFYKKGYKKLIYPHLVEPAKEFLFSNNLIPIIFLFCLLLLIVFRQEKLLKSFWIKLKNLVSKRLFNNLPLIFFLVAIVFLFISTATELRLFGSFDSRQFVEELSEANMAIALIFASLSLRYS